MGNATQSAVPNVIYRFGLYVLNPAAGVLTRDGTRVRLQDQPFRLLTLLVQRPGEIISREEIQRSLWPANTFVEFDKSLGVAVGKVREALADEAGNPRFIETIPRRGYRFIAPVSPEPPAKGLVSAAPRDAAGGPAMGETLSDMTARRRTSSHTWYRMLALTAAIVAIGFGLYRFGLRRQNAPLAGIASAKVRVRRSVAVVSFRNLPQHPEDNWLSSAFAEMLNTELAADGELRMISGEDVERAKRDLRLTDEDSLSSDTLGRLRKNSGADVVVLGSYALLPEKGETRIRLDVRIQDTARGETIAEQAFVGDEDHLFELVNQAGASLRKNLGSTPISGEAYAQARAAMPSAPLAVRLYTEGKARLWEFDSIHARELLIQAIAVEPNFPLAHAALSEAWSHLGYTLKARDEAERALSLSQDLGQEEKLLVQAEYYYTLTDHAKTTEVYRSLFSMFPDNLDYGLRLADEQRFLQIDDALRTIATLRRLPPPSGDDPRIDLVESRIWMNRDTGKAQESAQRGLQRAQAQGSSLLASRAYGILCETQQGELPLAEIMQDCEQARSSAKLAGEEDAFARNTNDLAGIYFSQGDMDRADGLYREALRIFRQTGDVDGISVASNNVGAISLLKGKLTEAAHAFSDAIPGYQEDDDQDGIALAFNNLGDVARWSGELKGAFANYAKGEEVAKKIDDKSALAYISIGRGDALTQAGKFDEARESYDQALALRKELGEKQLVGETEVSLARLAIYEGKVADAEGLLRNCKEQFHQDQQSDDELDTDTVLIEAFILESRYQDAAKQIRESQSLAKKSANEILRIRFDLVTALDDLRVGQLEAGRTLLKDVLRKTHSDHLLGIEFETRLGIAELESKSGERSKADEDLRVLEKDARAKGFDLIAANAGNLLGPNARLVTN